MASTGTMVLLLCASAFIAARRQLDKPAQMLLFGAVLTDALVCSKVLSSQFFLSLLAVLVMMPVPKNRWAAVGLWALIISFFVLAGIIFPWFSMPVAKLDPFAQSLVIARNACLVTLGISLSYRAWKASC